MKFIGSKGKEKRNMSREYVRLFEIEREVSLLSLTALSSTGTRRSNALWGSR
jgi:hypothetical protein